MIECTGDMFQANMDALVITTNGYVKANGDAVMGRGCAKQLADMFPDLLEILGSKLTNHGNVVHHLRDVTTHDGKISLVSMPVKPTHIVKRTISGKSNIVDHFNHRVSDGDEVPGFYAKSNTVIIAGALIQLVALADAHPEWKTIVMPRPGCGAGELPWEIVKPMLEEVLDDRFHVYNWN